MYQKINWILGISLSVVLLLILLSSYYGWIVCPYHASGGTCASCGMTRDFVDIIQGEWMHLRNKASLYAFILLTINSVGRIIWAPSVRSSTRNTLIYGDIALQIALILTTMWMMFY